MQFGTSECLAHWATYRPNSPAALHNGQTTSYGELNRRVNVLAARIAAVPPQSGRTAIATKAKFDTYVAALAAVRAGRSAVLLNTGLATSVLETNLRETSPDTIVVETTTTGLTDLANEARQIMISEEPGQIPDQCVFPEIQGRDEWGVFFSSGTTGTPKPIGRSHDSVVTELIGWCLELSLNRQTVFFIGRPVFYTGSAVLLLATLVAGGASILNDVPHEGDFEAIWRDYQDTLATNVASHAFFLPDQLRTFMKIRPTQTPLAADCILTMGGPISGAEKTRAHRLLGSKIVESWGNTEGLGTITEPDDLLSRPDSIGRPFLGDYMCLVDHGGHTLGPGRLGYISGGIGAGVNNYAPDDLIVSEDLGVIDADGYFYIRGREQDCFLLNGETHFTPTIEDALRNEREVLDCCVVAQPTKEDGVFLSALVVADDEAALSSLYDAVRVSVSAVVGIPGADIDVIRVQEIPRLPSGKVDRITAAGLAAEASPRRSLENA